MPTAPATHAPSPIARAFAVAIVCALTITVLATFRDYGITWDEEVQNTYGNLLLAFYTSGFQDRSAFAYLNLYFYGGFFDLSTAIVNQFTPFDIYATRHLLGGLLGIVGYIGVWRLTKLLAGEWAALLALALLVTTPLLYGHMFVNPKDAPFAWLTVWVLYYGARALMEGDAMKRSTVIGLGVALGLALGTRILAFAWLAAIFGATAVGVAAAAPVQPKLWFAPFWRRAKSLLWAVPIALALMAVFWPWSVTAPFNIGVAIQEFAHFPWTSQVLWDGELVMSNDLPPEYLPLLLGVQLPELILAGLGAAVALMALRLRGHGIAHFAAPRTQAVLLVAAVALLPILACAVLHPTLYNGMRHFLFLVPLLGILAAIGITRTAQGLLRRSRFAGLALIVLVGLGLGLQVWIAVDLHPNEYVYYNAFIGDLKGAEGRFELDYWGSSLAEASRALAGVIAANPETPPGGFKVEVCANANSVMHFLPNDRASPTKDRAQAHFYVGLNGPACRSAPAGQIIADVRRRGVTLSRAIDLRTAP